MRLTGTAVSQGLRQQARIIKRVANGITQQQLDR
jgi:hypothetical protein